MTECAPGNSGCCDHLAGPYYSPGSRGDVARSTTHTGGSLMYIDPGTGSLIIQVVGATLVAITASVKGLRQAVGSLISRLWRRER